MATIERYETKAGPRYAVRYRKPDRKQSTKRGFTTKRHARLWAADNEVSQASGTFIDPALTRITVGQLGEQWLSRQTHLKESTLRVVRSAWINHVQPKWGTRKVGTIGRTEVSAWVSELSAERGYTTVSRCLGVLSGILGDAVDDRRIPSNPAQGVKNLPKRTKGREVFLTHDQVFALADAAGEHRTLVLLLAYTGLRWGEATGLRVRALDMLKRRIVVDENAVEVGSRIVVGTPKSHERRAVPVPKFLLPLLARACEGKGAGDLVFAAADGGFVRRSKSGKGWFFRAARAAELPDELTVHDLRHTAASLAISAGANVKVVQKMLGHSSAAMTLDRYGHLMGDDLEAVSVRLDEAVRSRGIA